MNRIPTMKIRLQRSLISHEPRKRVGGHTSNLNKIIPKPIRQQRFRQLPKKLLQNPRHTMHIPKKPSRSPKINLPRLKIKHPLQLGEVGGAAGNAVDAFGVEPELVYGGDALGDDEGERCVFVEEELVEGDAECGALRGGGFVGERGVVGEELGLGAWLGGAGG